MTQKHTIQFGSQKTSEMAIKLFLIAVFGSLCISKTAGEMALVNVTRLATGDLFSLIGTDCGPTRCMEVSHGTALAEMGGDSSGCVCRCLRDTPAFREDQHVCVNHIDECMMATFGRGVTKPQIPFVFLPLKGQIIYPSKEIIFTDVKDAICAVTSAQYLSPSGWMTLRDVIDNDVPFGLYRDEGSTFLQWRGSAALHTRLEGRLVAAHVLCSASTSSHLAASCAVFRVAGASSNALLDVRSIPFHAGEMVSLESGSQNQGLSVLESLAICVCVLLLVFVYTAGIIFYVHYKQKNKRKQKDPEQNHSSSTSSDNRSPLESRIDMSNVVLKTNPLLKLNGMGNDFMNDASLSDVSEHTENKLDSSSNNSQKFQKLNSNVISAMVHSRRKKPTRQSVRQASDIEHMTDSLRRRSVSPDTYERAPHSDLSIIDCSVESHNFASRHISPSSGEHALRKKLYFNPVFFESELLKDPPPAAIDFLVKIREVMSISKEKMSSKRFNPILSDIPEEDLYHSVDLGWDIPCARRGRRFSAISLKQENSRKSVHCGGCPGCDNSARPQKTVALTRSNSCKSCVSEEYKQRVVRKWLDEVPTPLLAAKPVKSIAKVSGTPRVVESEKKEQFNNHVRPKSAELCTNEEKKFPNVKESILKDHIKDKRVKESTSKDVKVAEDMKSSIKVIQLKEKNMKEQLLAKSATVEKTQDKKSPSSHASRRIRKKLPPPPPPPVNLSEPVKAVNVEPVSTEIKEKMEAVIRELNICNRAEPMELEEIKMESIVPMIAPKIIIPVVAADSHYFSDDNTLSQNRKKEIYAENKSMQCDNFMDFDSLERNMLKKRRFSLASGIDFAQNFSYNQKSLADQERLTSSWIDMKKAVEDDSQLPPQVFSKLENRRQSISEVFIDAVEPLYDNITKPGPLTIQVRGSPVESRRHMNEDFDPDTLDRKPRRDTKKRVEKILLKSAGSFKLKSSASKVETYKKSPETTISTKIGNLRQIYESKAKAQEEKKLFYSRRENTPFGNKNSPAFIKSLKTPDLIRHIESQKDPKPPVAPKIRRNVDLSPKFSRSTRDSPPGERRRALEERFSAYTRAENLNARRSGRRSARTRSRRTDLRKLHRTEDSGYMSTDSNESKRRANYLMQLRPRNILPEPISMPAARTVIKTPTVQVESDTDDLESLGDGRSESGGESVETDSVFFGNLDDSKELFAELGLNSFEPHKKMVHGHEQIDSGFMGETNIILSGDSDSEHRSVISIVTGFDSKTCVTKLDDQPYFHTVEC